MDDRERLILLNCVSGIGSIRLQRLLEAFGSLRDFWNASEPQLQRVEGIGPGLAQRVAAHRRQTRLLTEELELARRFGCVIVTPLDADFPEPLRQIHDPPLAIYRKGAWTAADRTAVAIVGSRRASLYGRQAAERLAYDAALRGVTVVSGLALGIDAAAHRGALKALGRTIAVLGNGLASVYPPEHKGLAQEVAAAGCVISEYPMRMEPLAQNFPRRNRLISGLSLGVVVVEAAARSGALVTADCALEQGREVFAVPGQIDTVTSQGTHQLLKQGAKLVTSIEDIVEELRLEPLAPEAEESPEEERQVLEALAGHAPCDVDAVADKTGLPASRCAVALLQLELKQLVTQLPGKRFKKSG